MSTDAYRAPEPVDVEPTEDELEFWDRAFHSLLVGRLVDDEKITWAADGADRALKHRRKRFGRR